MNDLTKRIAASGKPLLLISLSLASSQTDGNALATSRAISMTTLP
jgi:hypothetical protein